MNNERLTEGEALIIHEAVHRYAAHLDAEADKLSVMSAGDALVCSAKIGVITSLINKLLACDAIWIIHRE